MSFWQRQQVKAAEKFLKWQYEKSGGAPPDEAELERQAAAVVDKARQIAKRTGRNVFEIVKDLIRDLKNRS